MDSSRPVQMDIVMSYGLKGDAETVMREISRPGSTAAEKTASLGVKVFYPRTGWKLYSLGQVKGGDISHASAACGQLLHQGRIKPHEAAQIDALLERLADMTA